MNKLKLEDIKDSETLYERDLNGREIKIFTIQNSQFDHFRKFYPDVSLYLHKNNSLLNPIDEKILSLEKLTNKEKQKSFFKKIEKREKCPVLFFIYNTENYYHFIYDTLPYLISFFHLKSLLPDLKLLINYPNSQTNHIYKFVTEFFALLKIENEDLIFVDDKTLYEKIYISSSYTHSTNSNLPPRNEIYDFYQKIISDNVESSDDLLPKKIYVSRRSWIHNDFSNIGTNYTSRRKMVNENELVDILSEKGFTEVFTERLNSIEKLKLFFNAECVIGAIGGGLCNVLFSKPKTKLLAIISPTFLDINERFKFSLNKVDTTLLFDTEHTELDDFKTNMRVECKELSIVGEVTKVEEKNVELIYTEEFVAGWNNQVDYKKISVEKDKCVRLDEGLNSPFVVNLNKVIDWVCSN